MLGETAGVLPRPRMRRPTMEKETTSLSMCVDFKPGRHRHVVRLGFMVTDSSPSSPRTVHSFSVDVETQTRDNNIGSNLDRRKTQPQDDPASFHSFQKIRVMPSSMQADCGTAFPTDDADSAAGLHLISGSAATRRFSRAPPNISVSRGGPRPRALHEFCAPRRTGSANFD